MTILKKYDTNLMLGGWPSSELRAICEDEVESTLDYFEIDKAVVYHSEARFYDVALGNDKLLDIVRNKERLIPSFVISPHYKYAYGGWEYARKLIKENGVRFLRIFPKEHGYSMESGITEEIFSVAGECNANIMIEMKEIFNEGDFENRYFEELCRKFPSTGVILTRVIHRRNIMYNYYLENLGNVYIETSLINNWRFYEETIKLHGSDRLLWGSSMPFNSAGSSITMLSYSDISETDKRKIAFENLNKLLMR
jgi:predicted TIM-barrel fold metal-dependent hydrolase